MAEHDSRNPILYVILVLLIANLVLTASLFVSKGNRGAEPEEAAANLPSYASDAELSRLAEQLQLLFNARDFTALYAEFDELAKVQFTQQDLEHQLAQFSSIVGNVESSAFSHFESARYGRYPAYVLHYKVRLIDGPFSTGTMKISVIDRGDHFGLMGFNVFGGSAGP